MSDAPASPTGPIPRASLPISQPMPVARLSRNAATAFDLAPDAAALELLAGLLGVSRLRKLRFAGQVVPLDGGGWRLEAQLGATVVQPCAVTLAPVTTRIDEPVRRDYLPDLSLPDAAEVEMPDDTDSEPLPEVIDPGAVLTEALALALPDYPRAPDAELPETVVTEPGRPPMRDADTRPLAGLAALRDKLGK